jgi:hypothetical protein
MYVGIDGTLRALLDILFAFHSLCSVAGRIHRPAIYFILLKESAHVPVSNANRLTPVLC